MLPYIVIITGESGAGKSTALHAFEDMNFLSIDNFPIRLLKPYLEEVVQAKLAEKLALVMDLRDPHFLNEFPKVYWELKERKFPLEIIYFTAETSVLITRYNQTRRPHPLLKETGNIEGAVKKEKGLLSFLKDYATHVLDTSNFTYHQLRAELHKIYQRGEDLFKPLLHIISFGFKYGLPFEANYLFDVRFLPNPYFVPQLRPLPGTDLRILAFLQKDQVAMSFLNRVCDFLQMVLQYHLKEDRRYLAVGIGCTGGRHRSPAIAKLIYENLKEAFPEVEVCLTLRDIGREQNG